MIQATSLYVDPNQKELNLGFEMTKLFSDLHQTLAELAEKQTYDLEIQNKELELASKKFLDQLKETIELQKAQSYLKPLSYTLEIIGSFMSITAGVGLCATGVFATCGAIMIATGCLGLSHTALQISGAYEKLASLFEDKDKTRIVMEYLPVLISTTLIISSAITGTITFQAQREIIKGVVAKYLPAIIKSLEASNMSASSFIFYRKSNLESKKIDQKQLSFTLETIIEEQRQFIFDKFNLQKNLSDQTRHSIKTISDLLQSKF